jgi:prepilin-type N-terminal cleavage/methylation domain-containing protein
MTPHTDHKRSSSGFTLVELLVAIALFSILVSIAAGGFVRALRSEREVSAMMSAESNVGIALEEMTREMRTGYLFCHDPGSSDPSTDGSPSCSSSCTLVSDGTTPATETWTCSNFIEFYNANGERVDYELQNGVLERSDDAEDNGAFTALTSSNVSTTYLGFTIFGNLESDYWNPRITIAIGVQPNDNTVSWPTANLETTVSARGFDSAP